MTTMRQLAAKHVLTSLERRRIATGAAQAENKYKAQRQGAFDSKLEMRGFGELQIRERLGEITERTHGSRSSGPARQNPSRRWRWTPASRSGAFCT